ncbi:MAG: single-stranded-DNA-specific exonuclease RecJ [Gemmatimonadaceae bacterium]
MTSAVVPAVPRPRRKLRWIIAEEPNPEEVAALAADLNLPPLVCRLLCARGYSASGAARTFLRPRLDQLHDPLTMLDLDKAVARLARAIREQELVFVHGDYDVDGISSTTLLTRTILHLGGRAQPFIPKRLQDGYDLSAAGVKAAIDAGAKVVVTCDCGTTAVEPIKDLCAAGIDVIVTDHHLPGSALPDCLAVLNPKRPGCGYPDKDLAAVGVVFKLALALAREMGRGENQVWQMLDLVALATVADIAPLRGENRVFVRLGLKLLQETRNVGLRALVQASGLSGKQITAGRVGFILAPRLNAVGRLGAAIRGVELLMTETEHEANVIARDLEELNRKRQEIDRATLEEAREEVVRRDLGETFGIVLARDGWHPGVIGIVASRIVEEFGRPTIMISSSATVCKGSGRSIPAFNLHAGLVECADLLEKFGGHKAAAGVTLDRSRLDAFTERFNEVARAALEPDDLLGQLRVDLEMPLAEATDALESLIRHFEPFGIGNPSPVFLSRGVRLKSPPRTLKHEGLKLYLDAGGSALEAIGWGFADRAGEIAPGGAIDVVYRIERDEYQGTSRLQARLLDFAPSR